MSQFVTNPGGQVHSVDAAMLPELLARPAGFDGSTPLYLRPATAEEIAAWHEAQGLTDPNAPETGAPAKRGK